MSSLEIKSISTKKSKIELRKLMKDHTIPSFAESVLLVGASGSGKTTLLVNLMTREDFYFDYFNFVFLFSTTGLLDDSFKTMKIPDRHTFTEEDSMISSLKIIIESQKELVEKKGIDKVPKIALIFEDLTSNKKLMKDPNFLLLWTAGRHLNMQVIACIHKLKALPRTQRLQAMNIIFFKGNNSEADQLADDFTPPNYSKKEMLNMINYATRTDKNSKHNFMYIANKVPFKTRYRKNFTEILVLDKL